MLNENLEIGDEIDIDGVPGSDVADPGGDIANPGAGGKAETEDQFAGTPNKRFKRGAKCWNIFEELEGDQAKVSLCEKVYVYEGSTSGLNKHLRLEHPTEFGEAILPSLNEKKTKREEK